MNPTRLPWTLTVMCPLSALPGEVEALRLKRVSEMRGLTKIT